MMFGAGKSKRAGRAYDKGDASTLVLFLADESPEVRALAARYLAMLPGDSSAIEPLIGLLDDDHSDVQWDAAHALRVIGGPAAIAGLARVLDRGERMVEQEAACALAEAGDLRAVIPLVHLITRARISWPQVDLVWRGRTFKGIDPNHWHMVLVGMGNRGVPTVHALLNDDEYRVREEALLVLRDICRHEQVVDPLVAVLDHPLLEVRCAAIEHLEWLGDPAAVDALVGALSQSEPRVRWRAAHALAALDVDRAAGPLVDAMDDPDWRVVHEAAWALGRADAGADAIRALVAGLSSSFTGVRESAAQSLASLAWEPPDAEHQLLMAMANRDWEAATALGERTTAPLVAALEVADYWFRRSYAEALSTAGWTPDTPRQRILYGIAAGDWKAVAALGSEAADELAALHDTLPEFDGGGRSIPAPAPLEATHELARLRDHGPFRRW